MSELPRWNAQQQENLSSNIRAASEDSQEIQRGMEGSITDTQVRPWKNLKAHNFGQFEAEGREYDGEDEWNRDPDLWLYRRKTTGLLQRYMRWSLEAGRVPSLLGRELFRSKISAHSATTFESRIIFLHDVEGCLERMGGFDRQIVARVVLQEHDHEGAARLLGCDRKTIERRLPEVLDELTEAFLRAELLEKLPETKDDVV